MVIGSLVWHDRVARGGTFAVAALLLTLRLVADDQLVKTDGSLISGHIAKVQGDQVWVDGRTSSGGLVSAPYYMSDIKSITMATPPEVIKVQAPGTPAAAVIAALEPQVKLYAGLKTGWVVDAMAQLGDAYTQVGQSDKALAIYTKIGELYPGSAYVHVADASKAQVDLDAGKIDDAVKLLQPIIDEADKNLAPSQADAGNYAKAFLVYGKVLLAQKKPQEALEKFLTVKTMFYQNPALVAEAEHYVDQVRTANKDDKNFGVQ